jgi:hypothetical protein
MKGRKKLRRAGIVLGFGALLSAGMLASGALGMVSAVSSGGTDSSSTATDTAPPPADPTSTDASSSTSTPADTTGSTTTDATSSTTTTTPAAAAPSISTDKADYAPGSTVTLTGSGWGPGESVHIFVNDDVGQSWKLDVDVFADLSGNMTYQFSLPNFFVADYSVTATGASGQQARTTFTDAVQLVFSGKDGTNSHTAAGTEEDLGTVPAGTAVSASCPSTGLEVKVTGLGSNSMSWAISYVSGYADNTALSTPSTRTTISPATGSFTGNGTQCVTFSVSTTGLSAGTYHGELRVAGTGGASATPDLYFFKFAVTSTTSTTSTSIARTTGSNPSTFGDALTFTATVTGSSGNPSSVGSVTFKDGATVVCNAVALSGNTATCSPSLAAGSHSLTAEYSGAAGFTASTSSALAQTVNPKSVTITPDGGQSKVFGAVDPGLTFANNGGLVGTDFSGSLGRVAGENVGNYAITLGSLVANSSNYSLVLSATTVNFAITPKPVTITPNSGQSKVFGAGDPTLTFTNSEGLASGAFSGGLSRESGEDVGSYAITLGSLASSNSNYSLVLSATTVNFAITPKPVTITPDSGQHKVFGAADPTFTFTNSEGLVTLDFSGSLGRVAGENVGNYAITLGSLVANSSNYTLVLSATSVNFEITPKSVTITPDSGQHKVFGAADPTLTFTNSESLAAGAFSGNLGRTAGEDVGNYAITLGSLVANSTNYTVVLSGSTVNFEITKKSITITPNAGQSKVFGESDPALTFAPSPALLGSDGFTGHLDRASGENVGLYAIGLGTLSAGGNYQLSLSGSTVNFEITKKQLSVNANDLTRVFGNSTPAPSASLTGFIPGQNAGNVAISGDASCTIDGGAGPDVGTYNDAIECGPGDLSAANYSFATGSKGKLTITKKPITITPDSGQHKVFGAADPALTFSPSPALLGSDGFTGALGRADGENVGSYAINLGALSAGGNYDLSLSGTTVNFAITKKPITITPDSGQSKVYGQPNPALTFTPSPALLGSDGFTGALGRATGENVGSYAINLGTLSAGGNYDLSLSGTTVNFAITKKQLAVNANDLVRTYLESTPAPSASFTGFIAGENAGNVTINGAASCSISPSAGPNAGTYVDSIECTPGTLSAANYSFATGSKGKLTINKANQTIAFPAIANKTLGSPDFDPGATASSGLGVSYAASPAGFCTIVSGNVHVVAIGACTVTASQSGSPNYNPAPDVARTFNVIYVFHGFFQPVDNDIFNLAQAGSAIPVKFDLNGDQGMNIFATGFPKVTAITCPSASTPVDLIEEVVAASTSGLQYGSGQYIYVWKTDKAWAGSCRQLEVKFADGVSKYVKVQFKK